MVDTKLSAVTTGSKPDYFYGIESSASRKYIGPSTYNVKNYGAVGDGSTNDTTAIQNAVNAALDAGGGTVYFPATSSYYKVTAPIVFTHNIPTTGYKLVRLQGERSSSDGVDGRGSKVQGSFNGFIFDNNDTQVLTVSGVVGTFIVGEPVSGGGQTTYNLFKVSVSGGAGTLYCPIGNGDFTGLMPLTITGGTSGAHATLTAQVYPRFSLAQVDSLAVWNTDTTAGTSTLPPSGALRMEGGWCGSVTNCWLSGMCGLWVQDSVFAYSVHNTYFFGQNNTAGSYGCVGSGGPFGIYNCNFIGWDVGVARAGSQGVIIGNRFEQNNTALILGQDGYGGTNNAYGFLVSGNQLEGNTTGFYFRALLNGAVIGNGDSGTRDASGLTNRQYGFKFGLCWDTLFAGNNSTGNLAGACFYMSGSGNQNITWLSNQGTNSGVGSSGIVFDSSVLGTSADRITFIGNDAASATTFANLPATAYAGDRYVITNCNTTTFNASAAGGGANIVPVFYNGSAWKVG